MSLAFDALDLDPAAVRARFAWARERGQPLYLWPDVSADAWRRALEAIGRAVADVLGGAPVTVLDGSAGAGALGIAAYTSGTGPLLGYWIEQGVLDAPEDVARVLVLHLEHGRRRAVRIAEGFAPIAARMAELGARATVVKGFHTARVLFPDPGTRPLSDVDLVAGPEHLPAVVRALTEAGFAARPVLADPYMSEWTPPGESALPRSLELTHVANSWGVDLHGSFDRDFGGAQRVVIVPRGPGVVEPWPAGGPTLDALAQPWLTAYLAAHASQELKNLTLVRLIELVWVIRDGVRHGTLDWVELRSRLEATAALRYVYPALELVGRLAPGTVDPRFHAAMEGAVPERVRRIVAGLSPWSALRPEGVSLEEQFMWADSPLSYARRVRRALWPAWAGSIPDVVRVQAGRLRQLFTGRVTIGRGGRR